MPGLIEPGQIWEHWTGSHRVKVVDLDEDGRNVMVRMADVSGAEDRQGTELGRYSLLREFFLVGRVQP